MEKVDIPLLQIITYPKRTKVDPLFRFRPSPFFGIAALIACVGLCLNVAGCTGTWLFEPKALESGLSPSEMKQYLEAVNAYQAEQYELADKRFTTIREQTANPATSRMALYGLACTRLMMATTPKDYQQALALWDTWLQCAPSKYDRENPTLFDAIIEKKMVFSMIPLKDGTAENQDPTQWFMLRANNELQKLKFQLENAQQSIDNRDAKIRALEKEISRLNEQIKALETIDQKIQKKKNSIPSAD